MTGLLGQPKEQVFDTNAPFVIVPFRGCKFFSGTTNKIEQALRLPPDRHGRERYDRLNMSVIAELVAPGDVCLDIGANIGVYSCVMSRLSGSSANVHAFEPAQHIRQKLIRNARLNGFDAMRINPFGLGEEDTKKHFFEVKEGLKRGGVSTFVRNENIAAMDASELIEVEVEVRMLDSYVEEAGLSNIKLAKIDVEGFEISVIRGGASAFARFRPFVLMEFDDIRHSQDAAEMQQIFGDLRYEGWEPKLTHGKLGFEPWWFEKTPKERNVLLIPR
jgi:FkbM family methyltransferase